MISFNNPVAHRSTDHTSTSHLARQHTTDGGKGKEGGGRVERLGRTAGRGIDGRAVVGREGWR